jgi:hypothetical protein
LGALSCDFLLGAELIYTHNKHHQQCFQMVLEYYLKPGACYFCVQSRNREGMPDFVSMITTEKGWNVWWQIAPSVASAAEKKVKLKPKDVLTGDFRAGEKQPNGFVQRDEVYVFYIIQKPGGDVEVPIESLSLPGGKLVSTREAPPPEVEMLRDEQRVFQEEKIEASQQGEKMMQQLLPKAFIKLGPCSVLRLVRTTKRNGMKCIASGTQLSRRHKVIVCSVLLSWPLPWLPTP